MNKQPHEIELTQYLMPEGKKTKVYAPIGEDYVNRAESNKMVFSCEVLTTGQVAIYGKLEHQSDEDELVEIANNGPDNSPTEALRKLVDRLEAESHLEEEIEYT